MVPFACLKGTAMSFTIHNTDFISSGVNPAFEFAASGDTRVLTDGSIFAQTNRVAVYGSNAFYSGLTAIIGGDICASVFGVLLTGTDNTVIIGLTGSVTCSGSVMAVGTGTRG